MLLFLFSKRTKDSFFFKLLFFSFSLTPFCNSKLYCFNFHFFLHLFYIIYFIFFFFNFNRLQKLLLLLPLLHEKLPLKNVPMLMLLVSYYLSSNIFIYGTTPTINYILRVLLQHNAFQKFHSYSTNKQSLYSYLIFLLYFFI